MAGPCMCGGCRTCYPAGWERCDLCGRIGSDCECTPCTVCGALLADGAACCEGCVEEPDAPACTHEGGHTGDCPELVREGMAWMRGGR